MSSRRHNRSQRRFRTPAAPLPPTHKRPHIHVVMRQTMRVLTCPMCWYGPAAGGPISWPKTGCLCKQPPRSDPRGRTPTRGDWHTLALTSSSTPAALSVLVCVMNPTFLPYTSILFLFSLQTQTGVKRVPKPLSTSPTDPKQHTKHHPCQAPNGSPTPGTSPGAVGRVGFHRRVCIGGPRLPASAETT